MRRKRFFQTVISFVGSVLVVSGGLLMLDLGITLAWQEPISALITRQKQNQLEQQLNEKMADHTNSNRYRQADTSTLARREASSLSRGDAVGRIELPTLDRSFVFAQGTDDDTLRSGPGHYTDTPLPGAGATVAIAGHRTTFLAPFRDIDDLDRGQPIVLRMPYGSFTYRVERTTIVSPSATWVKRDVGTERLVLTACHPLYSAAKRIVVFARRAESKSRPNSAQPNTEPSRDSSR